MLWFVDNVNIVELARLQEASNGALITDAELTLSIGSKSESGTLTGASIIAGVITLTAPDHGLTTGDQVIVTQVESPAAAVGVWEITVTDANHFRLEGASGTGTWTATTAARWYRGVTGATGLSPDIAADTATYSWQLPDTLPLISGAEYIAIITCGNYGAKWELPAKAATRTA
jgi:hypothetical protein